MPLMMIPIRGVVGAGETPEVEVPDHAPSDLVAAYLIGSNVSLTWADNSSNEDGFEIERATDSSDDADYVLIHTTVADVTSYTDPTASGPHDYLYRIRAVNIAGASSRVVQDGSPVTVP